MSLTQHIDRWVLTAATTANTANLAPTANTKNGITIPADTAIPVANATAISITATAPASNDSTDWDVNVIASNDGGTTFDDGTNHIYTAKNFTGDQTGSLAVTEGPTHIKIRTDENSNNDLAVTIYLTVTF